MITSPLQYKVDNALDIAVFENGYVELMTQPTSEVAKDLCTYCASLEDEEVDRVEACVQDYQQWWESISPRGSL
jgi:hypothetical protein